MPIDPNLYPVAANQRVAFQDDHTPSGTGAVTRSAQDRLRDLAPVASDFATPDALLGNPTTTVAEVSGQRKMAGLDGSEQFRIGWFPGAIENFRVYGGTAGVGASLVAWSETSSIVDGNFVAKGLGGFYFANGSGLLAAVESSGSGNRVANAPSLRPGDPGKPAVFTVQSWGGETNVGVALQPLGNGAVMAQSPDNGLAGGNPRGQNAVDWQTVRGSASAVASSSFSTIAGGNGNVASNAGAAVGGGQFNTASGANAWVPGGQRATTAAITGKGAFASGRFVADGDAQGGFNILRRQTTSAAAVILTSDGASTGASNVFNLPNNSLFLVEGIVVASQTGGSAGTAGDAAAWRFVAMVKRRASAATTAVSGVTVTKITNDAAAAAWTLTVTADTTNGGIAITGTGEANKNINWVARLDSVEEIG